MTAASTEPPAGVNFVWLTIYEEIEHLRMAQIIQDRVIACAGVVEVGLGFNILALAENAYLV